MPKTQTELRRKVFLFNLKTFIELTEEKKIETEFYDPTSKSKVLKQIGQQDILQFLTGSRFLPYLKVDIDVTC